MNNSFSNYPAGVTDNIINEHCGEPNMPTVYDIDEAIRGLEQSHVVLVLKGGEEQVCYTVGQVREFLEGSEEQ